MNREDSVVRESTDSNSTNKSGGDHNVLARTMNFEFLRPVFMGDTIICDATIEKYERLENKNNRIVYYLQLFYVKINMKKKY